ncbi:phosphatase PAP2 family protein [Sphingomonas sp. 22176]|uniref:phosphatase PAP2 family protein n=1 Tax=Sphingomonas sp. 22176 TaxID=3453884 RepID=UPI003F848FDB
MTEGSIDRVLLAILLCLPVFFLMPAAAAFDFYGYAPVPENARHYGRLISALHAHQIHAIDLADLGGIISFPSFHASMAVLFAWALWPFRLLRIVSLPLNLLMWSAAIPIGGHYVVDVLGGSLIALAALRLTNCSARPFRTRAALFTAVRGPVTS